MARKYGVYRLLCFGYNHEGPPFLLVFFFLTAKMALQMCWNAPWILSGHFDLKTLCLFFNVCFNFSMFNLESSTAVFKASSTSLTFLLWLVSRAWAGSKREDKFAKRHFKNRNSSQFWVVMSSLECESAPDHWGVFTKFCCNHFA